MMYSVRSLLSLLALLPLSLALDLYGRIELPGNATVPASSRVKLNHGDAGSWVRADGSFVVEGVEQGQHVLTPLVPGYTIANVLISIFPDESIDTSTTETIHIQPYHPTKLPHDPTKAPSLPYPFILYGRQDDYFLPSPGMNFLGLFKSPMVLMMLFSGVMMYAMPKLQESVANMDEETAAEMAAAQKKVQGMQSMDWAGGLSNMLAGAQGATTEGTNAGRAGTPPNGGNAKKRRGK